MQNFKICNGILKHAVCCLFRIFVNFLRPFTNCYFSEEADHMWTFRSLPIATLNHLYNYAICNSISSRTVYAYLYMNMEDTIPSKRSIKV